MSLKSLKLQLAFALTQKLELVASIKPAFRHFITFYRITFSSIQTPQQKQDSRLEKKTFEQVQIRSMTMTLASSTLQIRRHEYSEDMNIVILVIFAGISTFPFYAINKDVVYMSFDKNALN
ncbi:transmembrane protein, putative [Medicago truncatula]|uniref:Transmembrane protein, putative n=1 Tax=Medicago truncatula TaxID=3880 RepID=G7JF28_MEDTR|nr:transmembrane protein, putative [Medicago truncatula]